MTVSSIFDYGLFVTGRAGFREVAKLSYRARESEYSCDDLLTVIYSNK